MMGRRLVGGAKFAAGLGLICGMFDGAALGQKQTLHLDANKSEVHFNLKDPLHAVNGSFKVKDGTISFNRKDGAMDGGIVVDAGSGRSGNDTRDQRMAKEELKTESFATVTFAPRRFAGNLGTSGDSEIAVEGTFTLLGTPHEITVPLKVHMEGTQCRAAGSFTVPYVKWGLKDPSWMMLRVGKDVVVDLVLAGSVSGGAE